MRVGIAVNTDAAVRDVDTILGATATEVPRIVQAAGRRYLARAQADIPVNRRPRRTGRRPLATGFQFRDEGTSVRVVNVRPHAGLLAFGFQHVGGKAVGRKTAWLAAAMDTRAAMEQELEQVLPRLNGRLKALEVTR